MQQHWFECRKCNGVRVIYARGEVVHVPCLSCGVAMRQVRMTQKKLNITVSVRVPEREEIIVSRKSMSVPEILYEQLTLLDMSTV